MDSTTAWSADQRELSERMLYSWEQFRESDLWANDRLVRPHKVWSACIALTVGWGKASDSTYVNAIAREAKLNDEPVSVILNQLHERGIIVWEKERGTRKRGTLSLPTRKAESVESAIACTSCGAIGAIVDGTCGMCGADQSED